MVERRRPVEITLERSVADPAGGAPLTVRVSATIGEGEGAPAAAVSEEVARLRATLDQAVDTIRPGSSQPSRPDRLLEELIETYRPRQPELLDLLREEGELTATEYDLLRRHLATPSPARPPAGGVPITERPIAAAPLEVDRAPVTPRPVAELLRLYQISSLKQAGAVRARRQISFEEYMALKRHFQGPAPSAAPA